MKTFATVLIALCLTFPVFGAAMAQEGHDHSPARSASSHADVREFPDCLHCGMDREKFSHSRMLLSYADGGKVGTCSISCIAREKRKNPDKEVKSLQVADYDTRKLLDAKEAVWVVGGNVRGVMSPVAKWAFASKDAAERFIRANGGKVVSFSEAMKMAQEEPAKQLHR